MTAWRFGITWVAATIAAGAAVAAAPSGGVTASDALHNLLACRAIATAAERLACFDSETGALAAKQDQHAVVVLDAEEVRRTRRTLFGLSLPTLSFLGESKAAGGAMAEGVNQITDTIKAVRQAPRGEWVFDLASGGRWIQTDVEMVSVDPRSGMDIVIRAGPLGSFSAKYAGQRAIKVKRIL